MTMAKGEAPCYLGHETINRTKGGEHPWPRHSLSVAGSAAFVSRCYGSAKEKTSLPAAIAKYCFPLTA
jgi:hypothetical protein